MASVGLNHFGDHPALHEFRGLGDHLDLQGIGSKDLHFLIAIFHMFLKALPDFFNIHHFLLCKRLEGIQIDT
jgi:hypothetical protein